MPNDVGDALLDPHKPQSLTPVANHGHLPDLREGQVNCQLEDEYEKR